MKVILISGKAEAGKTTTANFIRDEAVQNGLKAVCVPYGDYVKHTAKLLWGWDGKKDESGRHLLQWWGTDIVRAKHPDFWVEHVINLADVLQDTVNLFIVDDCRFKNEIEEWYGWFLGNDIMTIRVERPGHENALTPEQRQHRSETELDTYEGWNYIISATDIRELEHEVYSKVIPALLK